MPDAERVDSNGPAPGAISDATAKVAIKTPAPSTACGFSVDQVGEADPAPGPSHSASEATYRTIFENTGTAIMILEEDTRISMANRKAEILTGYPLSELLGRSWTEFVSPEYLAMMRSYHEKRRIEGGEAPRTYDFKFVDRYGEKRDIHLTIDVIPGTKKSVASLLDITRHKQSEADLQMREAQFRALVETSPDIIWEIDARALIRYTSPQVETILGYEPGEVIDRSLFNLLSPGAEESFRKRYWEAIEAGGPLYATDVEVVAKDGRLLLLEIRFTPIFDDQGDLLGYRGMARDITDDRMRDRREAELRRQIDLILSSTKTNIDIIAPDFTLRYVDPAWREIYGDPTGRKCFEYFNRRKEPCPDCVSIEAHSAKRMLVNERVLAREDGRIVQVTTMPLQNAEGEWLVAQVHLDITERKKAEAELRESQERFRMLFEYAPDAYYMLDEEGCFLDGNKAAEEMIRSPREEMIGKHMFEVNILPVDQIPKAAEQLTRNLQGEATGPEEYTLIARDGTQVEAEIRTHPLKILGRTVILGIARDITSRKRDEEALRRSEAKLKLAFTVEGTGIWETDLVNGRIYVDQRIAEVLGVSLEEAPATPAEARRLGHPDDLPVVERALRAHLHGETPLFDAECRLRCRDGQFVWIRAKGVVIARDSGGHALWVIGTLKRIAK